MTKVNELKPPAKRMKEKVRDPINLVVTVSKDQQEIILTNCPVCGGEMTMFEVEIPKGTWTGACIFCTSYFEAEES